MGTSHLLLYLLRMHRRLHLLKYGKLPAQASPSVHFIEVWETPCWRDIHLSILERVGQSSTVGEDHGKLLFLQSMGSCQLRYFHQSFPMKYGRLPTGETSSVHSSDVDFHAVLSMSSYIYIYIQYRGIYIVHIFRIYDVIPKIELN